MKECGVTIKGGLARGFASIGAIDYLQNNLQILPRVVAGSSSGAIVAAGMAAGVDTKEGLRMAREFDFFRQLVNVRTIWANRSIVDPDLYRKKLEVLFGAQTKIEDLPVKLIVFATDPVSYERIFIEKGSLVDALMASSCYRPIFPKVKVQGIEPIDGDHSEDYSTSKLKEFAEVVIGVGYINKKGEKRRSLGEKVDIEILYEVGRQGFIDFGERFDMSVTNAFNAALLLREDLLSLIVDK